MDLDMPIPGRRTGVAAQESPIIADGGFSPPVVPGTLEIKNSGRRDFFLSPRSGCGTRDCRSDETGAAVGSYKTAARWSGGRPDWIFTTRITDSRVGNAVARVPEIMPAGRGTFSIPTPAGGRVLTAFPPTRGRVFTGIMLPPRIPRVLPKIAARAAPCSNLDCHL